MKIIFFVLIFSLHVKAEDIPKFKGEPRWQSSLKGEIFGTCSNINEHGSDNTSRSYRFTDNKFDCNKLQNLKIIEFAQELLGSSKLNRQGILNAKEKDSIWKDSRQLGELLRAVAIKKVLIRHRDLLGVPMDNFDKNKCYQFKKGMGKINNKLKEGVLNDPLKNQNHPLNPIKQHQLVHAAKSIQKTLKEISSHKEQIFKIAVRYDCRGTATSGCHSRLRKEQKEYRDKYILPLERKIENIMAANPFLSLDREKEWCVINCSDKLWEYQPWIEKISTMEPQSEELVEKIKYFMAKTSSDLKRSVNSLCQVYSDEGKLRTDIQKNYQEKNDSWGAWGKWALSFWDPAIFIGMKFRDKQDFKNCLSAVMNSESNDITVKYIKHQINGEKKVTKELAQLVRDQCIDEKPFGWKNLMGMTSVLQEVTTKFGFTKFAGCFQKKVDAISGVKENLALGLGLGCLAAVPIAPVVAFGCGALDVAAMYSVNSDARIHYDQMSSCRAAPNVCSDANVKASIRKYYSTRNDFLLSVIGEGTGVIAEVGAKANKASRAAKDAAKVIDKFQEIERSFAHLPTNVTNKISDQLKIIEEYGTNEEKLRGLMKIEDEIETIRENQQKAIRLAGDKNAASKRYKCLFPQI
jgi:hypothetical protein